MAVPVGSSSSYWASIDRSSSFHKNPKFTAWQYVGKGFEIHLSNVVKGRTIYGIPKSNSGFPTRRQTPFAASDGKLPHGEPDSYASETQSTILMERTNGKPGFISFHGLPYQKQAKILGLSTSKGTPKFLLFVGPTVLVAFLVFPSLYLRRILSSVFEDSLLTDFLILFFTEALFYGGLAIFLLLVDRVWRPVQRTTLESCDWSRTWFEPRVFSVATLVLSLIIPLVTMGMVWPWTGPAASATLAPYLVGLVVQFAFEQYSRHHKSPAWPVIPIVFQVYRLHQLNRAAQLVTALSFSVRGAESTPQTSAINGSLGTLLTVLQILGVICVWSLSSFVMRFLPSSEVIPEP